MQMLLKVTINSLNLKDTRANYSLSTDHFTEENKTNVSLGIPGIWKGTDFKPKNLFSRPVFATDKFYNSKLSSFL